MNIIMTLPRYIIDKILSGEKEFEYRCYYPKKFNWQNNKIFVVQKGTGNVVMWMTIGKPIELSGNGRNIAKKEAKCKNSFLAKMWDAVKLYMMPIALKHEYSRPLDLFECFDRRYAPQRYIYTKHEYAIPFQDLLLGTGEEEIGTWHDGPDIDAPTGEYLEIELDWGDGTTKTLFLRQWVYLCGKRVIRWRYA